MLRREKREVDDAYGGSYVREKLERVVAEAYLTQPSTIDTATWRSRRG
jgi:hypothetical protein